MTIIMLGTGNALVKRIYNTCYVIEEDGAGNKFLVDAGGGNGIMRQLDAAGIAWQDLHDIFCTHKHIDHIMGMVWLIRLIGTAMSRGTYEGEVRIYGHEEVIRLIRMMAEGLLQPSMTAELGRRIRLVVLEDGDRGEIIGHPVTFFDIHSTKARQFGYRMDFAPGRSLVCCGDEPFNAQWNEQYARGADTLLHEAFCLYGDREVFHPYEKHHSTVREAAETAQRLDVKNLILYHTEEKTIAHRKALYTKEAQQFYDGRVFVPEDLERIEL